MPLERVRVPHSALCSFSVDRTSIPASRAGDTGPNPVGSAMKMKDLFKKWKEREKKTKVFIRIERDGKFIDINLPIKMIDDVYDATYMISGDTSDTMKLNKVDENFWKFADLVKHICHDIIDDGVCVEGGNDLRKDSGWKEVTHYLVKKPTWKSIK